MNSLADRLRLALRISGKTKTDIWKACGISSGAVTHWFNGSTQEITGTNLTNTASVLGVNAEWLATGKGLREASNIASAPDSRGFVPLISNVQAGEFSEAIDALSGDYEQVPISITKSRYTFALAVVGDSMSPDFPEGTRLIVEPEMQFQAGDYVIAKNGEEATFKQLVRDSGEWYLKPINPQYPTKPLGGSRIIGVVRESVRKFR